VDRKSYSNSKNYIMRNRKLCKW